MSFTLEQARAIVAAAPTKYPPIVDSTGALVSEVDVGARLCAFYITDPAEHGYEGEATVHDGSLYEVVEVAGAKVLVVFDNYDDEDKTPHAPGGEFCDFLVLQQ